MNTVAVSAAVSAVVSVTVGTIVNWGERIVSWAYRRATPDHVPIGNGSGWSTTTASSTDQVRVLVCCAPNRSLRRRELNPDRAVSLIRSQFAGVFPDQPVFSMPEHGVRFESASGVNDGYAWAHAGGRIDLCVTIPTTAADPGPISISVLEIVSVVLRVIEAVRSSAYAMTYGARGPHFWRRFDWAIAVSPTVVGADGSGNLYWQELTFPGVAPPRSGTKQQPYCPPGGYASQALRSQNVQRPESDIVRVFLRDFLYQNGYHDIDKAVGDLLGALDLQTEILGVV
jgi:hypothetical protein